MAISGTAPTDGTRFLAVVAGSDEDDLRVRVVQWGKTSHVPMRGHCLADQGAEDFDLCEPLYWMPLPEPPKE